MVAVIRWWVECDGGWGNWKINLRRGRRFDGRSLRRRRGRRRGRRFDGLETSTIGRPWWNTHYIFAKCTLTSRREVCKTLSKILNSKWSDFADSGIFNSTPIPLLHMKMSPAVDLRMLTFTICHQSKWADYFFRGNVNQLNFEGKCQQITLSTSWLIPFQR